MLHIEEKKYNFFFGSDEAELELHETVLKVNSLDPYPDMYPDPYILVLLIRIHIMPGFESLSRKELAPD